MHPSDQITRKGLERIREYCKKPEKCEDCNICSLCCEFQTHLFEVKRETIITSVVPRHWTDSDITEILKITRNYMETAFIRSLKKIVKQNGDCDRVGCITCPFDSLFSDVNNDCEFALSKYPNMQKAQRSKKEIAEWLLEVYKGEVE